MSQTNYEQGPLQLPVPDVMAERAGVLKFATTLLDAVVPTPVQSEQTVPPEPIDATTVTPLDEYHRQKAHVEAEAAQQLNRPVIAEGSVGSQDLSSLQAAAHAQARFAREITDVTKAA